MTTSIAINVEHGFCSCFLVYFLWKNLGRPQIQAASDSIFPEFGRGLLLLFLNFLFIFYFLIIIIFFILQYCIGFAIHQHASAMGIHMFPILRFIF